MHSKFIRKIILFSLKSTCASVPQLIDNKNKDNSKKTSRVLTQLSDRSMWQKKLSQNDTFLWFSRAKNFTCSMNINHSILMSTLSIIIII